MGEGGEPLGSDVAVDDEMERSPPVECVSSAGCPFHAPPGVRFDSRSACLLAADMSPGTYTERDITSNRCDPMHDDA